MRNPMLIMMAVWIIVGIIGFIFDAGSEPIGEAEEMRKFRKRLRRQAQ